MRLCWRCGGRFLIRDEDFGLRCGTCARPQFVRDTPLFFDDASEVPVFTCESCGQKARSLRWKSDHALPRFCSSTCRNRAHNRAQKARVA